MREKAKYRTQWDYNDDGIVVGYWVWTCNDEAIALKSSFYMNL